MTKLILSALLVLAATTSAEASSPANAESDCLVPQRAEEIFRRAVVRAVTESDSVGRWFRLQIDLPVLSDTNDVFYVDDPLVCLPAARALAIRYAEDTLAPARVHVLKVGSTRYIVFNNRPKRESWTYTVYDEHFNFIKGFTL